MMKDTRKVSKTIQSTMEGEGTHKGNQFPTTEEDNSEVGRIIKTTPS